MVTLTAMHPSVGMDVATVSFAIQVILYSMIGSLGAAGVGGGNLQATLMTMSMMGIGDLRLLVFLYSMDFFVGLVRPTLNQNGSMVAGVVAQKLADRAAAKKARKEGTEYTPLLQL